MPPEQDAGSRFAEAVLIMARLRAPGGCPWDREQTFDSIRKYTLEETYEVLDAIERRDWSHLKEELGDLLLQVLFYSEMASEAHHFSISDVILELNRKLIRRHPHVFGDEASAAAGNTVGGLETDGIDAKQVLRNWEEIKQREKGEKPQGRLDGVPRALPALLEASQIGAKAAKCGFDWLDFRPVFDKFQEEIKELEEELGHPEQKHDAVASELGDLLFTAVNLARHLKINPEIALHDTNTKFRRRFSAMEALSKKPLEEISTESLEDLWNQVKARENQ